MLPQSASPHPPRLRAPALGAAAAAFLLLAGCRNEAVPLTSEEFDAAPSAPDLGGLLPPDPAADSGQLRAKAEAALAAAGVPVVQILDARAGRADSVCGTLELAGSGPDGGMRPFLVSGEEAMVAPQPTVAVTDPTDPFADYWLNLCASLEELRIANEAIARASGAGALDLESITLPPDSPPPPETPPPPVAAAEPSPLLNRGARAPAQAAPNREAPETFSDAVIRPAG